MSTISESNASLVSSSETVDTTGIPLEQFAAHSHQVDNDDHSTLFVLQEDSGGADQDVRVEITVTQTSISLKKAALYFMPWHQNIA